ncbi:hypothetical protein BHM03_00004619 [Ensete ventricosum]|nr:hypothetical protein BHM03_00004619 [Ensete ventricosum]
MRIQHAQVLVELAIIHFAVLPKEISLKHPSPLFTDRDLLSQTKVSSCGKGCRVWLRSFHGGLRMLHMFKSPSPLGRGKEVQQQVQQSWPPLSASTSTQLLLDNCLNINTDAKQRGAGDNGGSDRGSDDPSFKSRLRSTQQVNDEVTSIFTLYVVTTTTICVNVDAERCDVSSSRGSDKNSNNRSFGLRQGAT